MKGKFALYYDFIEEENLIVIKFFRSTKQKSLEQFFKLQKEMITTEELKTILFKRRFGVFKTAPKEPSPLQRDN